MSTRGLALAAWEGACRMAGARGVRLTSPAVAGWVLAESSGDTATARLVLRRALEALDEIEAEEQPLAASGAGR